MKYFKVFTITITAFAVTTFANFSSFVHAADPPSIQISALSPGYTINGAANTGEFIELRRLSSSSISLAGLSLRYTNTSKNTNTLLEFPEGSQMTGETLLLRLASSPGSELADATYTKQLALSAGPLELVYDSRVIDSVCWTGKGDCYKKFTNTTPTTLVRTGDTFEHRTSYQPAYDSAHPSLYVDSPAAETAAPKCRGLQFSELFTYFESDATEQFIEFYNPTDNSINLTGCAVQYKTKTLALSGTIPADGYLAYYPAISAGLSLTKNPSSSNTLTLVDADGAELDTLTYKSGQRRGVSYAQFEYDDHGEEQWRQTYHPTPGEPNDYQQYRSCSEGKIINEATGNCVKSASLDAAKPCPAGKYRNPLTGRCKSYSSSSTPKPCAEGYERNPETNRCRKIRNNSGADYALDPTPADSPTTFVAFGAVALIASLGATYVVFQFRHELAHFFRHPLAATRSALRHLRSRLPWHKGDS